MMVREMIDMIVGNEGDYSNHKHDKGGATMYGVTIKALAAWRGHPVTVDDVRSLKIEEAREIFETVYYLQPGIDRLPAILQPIIFDISVNSGPNRAIRILQSVVAKMGRPLVIDGKLGNNTVQAANIAVNVYHSEVITQLVNARLEFYNSIVAANPAQAAFLAGWTNRAKEFLT